MALRGKKPTETNPRLKALMFGDPGAGKTIASLKMPKPYVIDTEKGAAHYGDQVAESGGVTFETTSMSETIAEIKALMSEPHDFLTLVIDPFTTLYETLLDEGEREVGTEFGRHYGYANKQCKRLYSMLATLDMNVVCTAHAKNEYGDGMKVIGKAPDAWKKLPYLFDLVLRLERRQDGARVAEVTKTRLAGFEDGSRFEWSFDALADRYGRDRLVRKATTVELATLEQVAEFKGLLGQLSEEETKRLKIDKAIAKVGEIEDFTAEAINKGIDLMKRHLGA